MAKKQSYNPKKHPRYGIYIVLEIVFGVAILAGVLAFLLYSFLS